MNREKCRGCRYFGASVDGLLDGSEFACERDGAWLDEVIGQGEFEREGACPGKVEQ